MERCGGRYDYLSTLRLSKGSYLLLGVGENIPEILATTTREGVRRAESRYFLRIMGVVERKKMSIVLVYSLVGTCSADHVYTCIKNTIEHVLPLHIYRYILPHPDENERIEAWMVSVLLYVCTYYCC